MKLLRDKHKALIGSRSQQLCVMATGGGAYKFYDTIRDALEVEVLREDEMECLIAGKRRENPEERKSRAKKERKKEKRKSRGKKERKKEAMGN